MSREFLDISGLTDRQLILDAFACDQGVDTSMNEIEAVQYAQRLNLVLMHLRKPRLGDLTIPMDKVLQDVNNLWRKKQ